MKKLNIIFTILMLASCQHDDKSKDLPNEQEISTSINLYKGKVNLDNLITDFKIIPLNYPKIIANIDKVKFFRDKIYVQDSKTISLLEFTTEGKFVRQIGHVGAGPGEYLSVHDFDIDEDTGHIYILSLQKMSLLEYDQEGKYIHAFKMPVFASNFVLQKGRILFLLNSNANELSGKCDLIIFDRSMNFISKNLCRDNVSDFISSLSGDIGVNPQGVYVTKALESSIYYYKDGILTKKYSIDFGRDSLPEEFKHTFSAYRSHALEYKYLSKPILENDKLLSFYYMNKSRITFFIKDKERNISYDDATNFEYNGFNRAIAGFGIIGLKDEYFLAKVDSDALSDKVFKMKNRSPILEQIINMHPQNHVLVLFKLNLP